MNSSTTTTAHHSHTPHHYHPYHRASPPPPPPPPLPRYIPPTNTTAPAAHPLSSMSPSISASPKEAPRRGYSGDDRDYGLSSLPPPQGPQRQSLPSISEALGQAQPMPYPPRQQTQEFTPKHSSSQLPPATSHSPDPGRNLRHHDSQSSEGSSHNRSHTPFSPATIGTYNHSSASSSTGTTAATTTTTTAPSSITTSGIPRNLTGTPGLQSILHPSGPAPPSTRHSPPPPSHSQLSPPERGNGYSSSWAGSHPSVNGHDDRASHGQTNGAGSHFGSSNQPPAPYSSSHRVSVAEPPPPPPPNHPPHPPYHDSRGWRSEEAERYQPDSYGGGHGESIKRHLEVFDLDSALNEIADSSRQLLSFSNHYCQKAHNTHRSGPLPGSTPHLTEIDTMMKQSTRVHDSLNRMRSVILTQQAALAERSKEQAQKTAQNGGGMEHHNSYSADPKLGGFAGADPKKRRGRAAPPGRCHSCNRAETPEWRRGPDGARTLCNACGLHYAKLTRKMGGSKAAAGNSSNLRPKMENEGGPNGA